MTRSTKRAASGELVREPLCNDKVNRKAASGELVREPLGDDKVNRKAASGELVREPLGDDWCLEEITINTQQQQMTNNNDYLDNKHHIRTQRHPSPTAIHTNIQAQVSNFNIQPQVSNLNTQLPHDFSTAPKLTDTLINKTTKAQTTRDEDIRTLETALFRLQGKM